MTETPILSHPVEIVRIPPSGLTETIVAGPSQRRALAAEYGLLEVQSLAADLSVARDPSDSLLVEGRIRADIVQSCVVSLEPVAQHIDEPVAVRFVPPGSSKALTPAKSGSEVLIDPDAEDPPEVLTGTTLDLGAVVAEHFALAIDPYPRAPGAVLPPEGVDEPTAGEDSPFAVLAGLGKPRDSA